MDIFMIWADGEGGDLPWLVDAWGEYMIDDNEDGWHDAIKEAKQKYKEIRIAITTIDEDAVAKLFAPVCLDVPKGGRQ